MLVSNVTQQEQEAWDAMNRNILDSVTQLYIRKEFGKAYTTKEAESWITLAQEKGFLELALELQNDLITELHITLS